MTDDTAELLETVPQANVDLAARNQTSTMGELREVSFLDREAHGIVDTSMANSLQNMAAINFPRGSIAPLFTAYAAWAFEEKRRYDLQQAKSAEMEAERLRVTKQLSDAQVKNAALEAENRERERHQPLVGIAYVFGTLLFSTGAERATSDTGLSLGIVLILMGLTLLGVGYMVSRRGAV